MASGNDRSALATPAPGTALIAGTFPFGSPPPAVTDVTTIPPLAAMAGAATADIAATQRIPQKSLLETIIISRRTCPEEDTVAATRPSQTGALAHMSPYRRTTGQNRSFRGHHCLRTRILI